MVLRQSFQPSWTLPWFSRPANSNQRRYKPYGALSATQQVQQGPSTRESESLRASSLPRVLRGRDYGALEAKDFSLFVQFFRQASPYIAGHRGRTFVLALPGEVVDHKEVLHSLLEDVALLHGLGVKLVLVVGVRMQINKHVLEEGVKPRYEGGYRVTDTVTMAAAIEEAGKARMEIEARLSKGPAVTMVRRHERGGDQSVNFGPALSTVTGNYVAAKRKGVVDGVDYQHTGVVRFVQTEAVRKQLESGNVVLLSNLGYSAAGEVLNCDTYTVATRAAVDLQADKLILLTLPETQPLDLPQWLPLSDAERLLKSMASTPTQAGCLDDELHAGMQVQTSSNGSASQARSQTDVDFDKWYECGLPLPLLAACTVCRAGIKRAHLVDARIDGGLLLELYSRDGVGCMISTDFYEGIRPAAPQDLAAIRELLAPLEEKGILVRRSPQQMEDELPHFFVLERESKVLGCAAVKPLGRNAVGEALAEFSAFCVHPTFRGSGKGDSFLEYLETDARSKGIQKLVLLTTRTADWFEQRGFRPAGPAHASQLLPDSRRGKIDPARNSQLFVKDLQ
ncbi:hypothetical protein N2152v2_002092 [Parachlorella kessleri]